MGKYSWCCPWISSLIELKSMFKNFSHEGEEGARRREKMRKLGPLGQAFAHPSFARLRGQYSSFPVFLLPRSLLRFAHKTV
jgi:hypothetical protein